MRTSLLTLGDLFRRPNAELLPKEEEQRDTGGYGKEHNGQVDREHHGPCSTEDMIS